MHNCTSHVEHFTLSRLSCATGSLAVQLNFAVLPLRPMSHIVNANILRWNQCCASMRPKRRLASKSGSISALGHPRFTLFTGWFANFYIGHCTFQILQIRSPLFLSIWPCPHSTPPPPPPIFDYAPPPPLKRGLCSPSPSSTILVPPLALSYIELYISLH